MKKGPYQKALFPEFLSLPDWPTYYGKLHNV